MWMEIIMLAITALFKNCPIEATRENVHRVLHNPTQREKRQLRFYMRVESDRQLDNYLEGGPDVALGSADLDYFENQICEKLGIQAA